MSAPGSPISGGGAPIDGAELARRMVAASEAAAAAAKSMATAVQGMKNDQDWSKLLPKPGIYEPKTREEEVAGWKDWWWTVSQYLYTLDATYSANNQLIEDNLETVVLAAQGPLQRRSSQRSCMVCWHPCCVADC